MRALLDHWRVTADGWEAGSARLQWLIAFGQCAPVVRAAALARPVLEASPSFDPVEPHWLHMTAGERHTPRPVEPFLVHFERVELWPTGVMLVPEPCEGLEALGVEQPHVTLAYANAETDVDGAAVLPPFEPCAALVTGAERVWLRRHDRSYAWDAAARDPDDRPA